MAIPSVSLLQYAENITPEIIANGGGTVVPSQASVTEKLLGIPAYDYGKAYKPGNYVHVGGMIYQCKVLKAAADSAENDENAPGNPVYWVQTTLPVVHKYVHLVEELNTTTVPITHYLGTKNITLQAYKVGSEAGGSTYTPVTVNYTVDSDDAITLKFASAHQESYHIVIMAAK